jgi:IclR family acetate operon transcriptional repressor
MAIHKANKKTITPDRFSTKPTHENQQRASFSTTVAKAMNIVDILADNAEVGIGLNELSVKIGMPKSSTHRYMATLLSVGLAEKNGDDRFKLGTKVIELAGSFLANSDLRSACQATMDELAERTGETIHLAVPSGTGIVYIAKIESKHALGMSSHLGTRLPMYCTSLGKAILAFSSADLINSVLSEALESRTPNTITSPEKLKSELQSVYNLGFAIDNEENEPGICCVGAPILDFSGKAIAALSISGPRERMPQVRAQELGPHIWECTRNVSRRWGFSGQLLNPKIEMG